MKRRIIGVFAAFALALMGFCGCGESGIPDDNATNEGYTAERKAAAEYAEGEALAGQGIPKEEIKIGVLYITDPKEGSGYSFSHDLGIQGMQDNLGLSEAQIVRKVADDSNQAAVRSAMQECIDDGCNIIFATSWGYMDVTAEMAEEYPDVYFSHGTGYKSNGANFNHYFGRIYQPRYLSGIVAGMNTKSNKIGYVAAMDSSNSEVTGGIDAFAIGVASVNPEAEVYVAITNSWYDPPAEEAASKKLLALGCDVMAQHCDTPYPQTLAQESGVYGIGYNSDMSKETPDSCLCSVIWNWSAYYTSAVSSIIAGTWDGSDYYGGMAEGIVQITDTADFCAQGTEEKVAEAEEAILSGRNNVFDGVLETNDGELVGSENTTLDDAVITGGINWYYKNVVIVD